MTNTSAESSKKPRGKSFEKGKSGNPGGRPKLPEDIKHVRELARQYTQSAVAALVEVMDGDSAAAKVAAANALLDRGWGKPEQAITGLDGGPIQQQNVDSLSGLSGAELDTLKRLLAKGKDALEAGAA